MAQTPSGIVLDTAERNRLEEIINDENEAARTKMRARILLASDFSDKEIKTKFYLMISNCTNSRTRSQYTMGILWFYFGTF